MTKKNPEEGEKDPKPFWVEGVKACQAGKSRTSCPYKEGSDEQFAWFGGFDIQKRASLDATKKVGE